MKRQKPPIVLGTVLAIIVVVVFYYNFRSDNPPSQQPSNQATTTAAQKPVDTNTAVTQLKSAMSTATPQKPEAVKGSLTGPPPLPGKAAAMIGKGSIVGSNNSVPGKPVPSADSTQSGWYESDAMKSPPKKSN